MEEQRITEYILINKIIENVHSSTRNTKMRVEHFASVEELHLTRMGFLHIHIGIYNQAILRTLIENRLEDYDSDIQNIEDLKDVTNIHSSVLCLIFLEIFPHKI